MSTPSVLFVCVRNSGKSQMAAALMRQAAGNRVRVYSAGTDPGPGFNALSVQVLEEVGADIAGEAPKPVDPHLLAAVDLVVVLGREARLDSAAEIEVRTWDTDEPSLRGIDGVERMRLVRDDIAARVNALLPELLSPAIHNPIPLLEHRIL
ncbi:low molecular weight phosphatase family protein [Nocardia fusca]|uniref:low molecular weight phosphatase family protein n=1 Tax=Nocardia fusca TaxID=941183 RepID=UPI0037C534D5